MKTFHQIEVWLVTQPEILKQKKIVHTTTNSELMLKGKLGGENKKQTSKQKSNIVRNSKSHNVIGEKNWRIQKQRYLLSIIKMK